MSFTALLKAYMCQCKFSILNNIECDYRSHLLDVDGVMKVWLSRGHPRIDILYKIAMAKYLSSNQFYAFLNFGCECLLIMFLLNLYL